VVYRKTKTYSPEEKAALDEEILHGRKASLKDSAAWRDLLDYLVPFAIGVGAILAGLVFPPVLLAAGAIWAWRAIGGQRKRR